MPAIAEPSTEILELVPSSSGNGYHEIRLGRDGVTYCTCKGWQIRKTCRHLEGYMARNSQPASQPPPPRVTSTFTNKRGQSVESPFSNTEAIDKLRDSTREFAQSLYRKYTLYDKLSPEQWYWVHKLAVESEVSPAPAEDAGDLMPIIRLFQAAAAKVDKPQIIFYFDDMPIGLTLATGARTKYPGAVFVSNGEKKFRSSENIYYGRISPQGKLIPAAACDENIVAFLRVFASKPAEIAAEAGKMSGKCCFCRKELTDERSLEVGYGLICSTTWKLPWGAK